jgi:acyl carrier protein
MAPDNQFVTSDDISRCVASLIPDLPQDPSHNLVDGQLLDSYSIIELVDRLETHFAVRFGPDDLTFDNLMSVEAMASTVNRLRRVGA